VTVNETSAHGPVVRYRYRPAEFEAERYSPEHLSFWTPIVVRLGHIHHDDEVLDLGSGTGGLTVAVADATGARVVGCDLSSALLDYGRRVRGRVSTPWVCADGKSLPFGPGCFDRVIASLVLHQVRDRQEVLIEISNVLRSGGRLVVRTVTPEAAMRWIPHRFFPSIARAQADRMPSTAELTDRITHAGFHDVDTQTVVRAKRLKPDEVEGSLRRDVADRYPFVDDEELRQGLQRMRTHWATRRDDWFDHRRFTFLTGVKPRGSPYVRAREEEDS
jgi:ubiquinone/menaquinone biosynthesis C-methylase UbiE